ncbi:Omp28-related outer membrane protein [Filimonas effusa]|uniref:Omp28-related outer membrane protein n=1 Tax=Filimonas effusa TaxID=2508721 RepID=A0A4V1M9U9_9BACT|nr:Omp28-related outer membrane protein [Filimonas effusa]RXK82934.1 Omp28-related outer membrane protein [Filimonas effusa]
MKRTLFSSMFACCLVAMLLSCSKGSGGSSGGGEVDPPVNPPVAKDSIYVTLSKDIVEKNGFDFVAIRIKDKAGKDITSVARFYIDGISTVDSIFIPTTVKDVKITAKRGDLPSNEVTLRVKDGGTSPYTQKVLVEDYTGTWCQYCPRAARILEAYIAKKPNCITVGIHGGGGSDPFYFTHADNLCNAYGINSFPWALVNHGSKWNEETSVLDAQFTNKWPPLGIAIQSTVSGTAITGKVKVKYATASNIPMKVMIMLVEDGLVYPQVNAYNNPNSTTNPYYGPNPIPDFVHANVLRQIGVADIYNGDAIPLDAQVKNNEWTKDFTFSTTGKTATNNAYNINVAKSRIVAYVIYGSNQFNLIGTANVQIANVGETKNYD